MNPTATATKQGYRLKGDEGINNVWWPYVLSSRAGKHTNKIMGEQTEGRLSQLLVSYPRGSAPPLHIHHREDETFYIVDGEVSIFVADQRIECTAGDFVFGPRGVPHAFLVQSEQAEMLVTFTPAGIEGLFAEVGPPVLAGEPAPAPAMPDEDEFARLMAKYGCEFVGPPPTLD